MVSETQFHSHHFLLYKTRSCHASHDYHLESGEDGGREGRTTFSNLRLKQRSMGVFAGLPEQGLRWVGTGRPADLRRQEVCRRLLSSPGARRVSRRMPPRGLAFKFNRQQTRTMYPTHAHETDPRGELSPFVLRSNEPKWVTVKLNNPRMSRYESVFWGKALDRIGLGKWTRKTLDLDGGRSLQLCLHSLPTSSG